MPTQRLNDARLVAASTPLLSSLLQTSPLSPQLQMSSYAAPLIRAQVVKPRTISAETEWPDEAFVNLRDLRRGVGWALAIESAAALSCYIIWHLWHIWL